MYNNIAPKQVSTAEPVGMPVNPAKLDPTNDEVGTAAMATQNGCTPYQYISVNTGFDAVSLKASAGRLYFIYAINLDGVKLAWLKIYDKATAPDPSADTALLKWQLYLPPTEPLESDTEPQYEPIIISLPHGINFANGIAFVLTQLPGTDETAVDANDVLLNLAYK